MDEVKNEIETTKQRRAFPGDRFVVIMDVSYNSLVGHSRLPLQPFANKVTSSIIALKQMGDSIDKDLHSLLQYYGENTEDSENMKPEEFFGLITSFALALDVCLACFRC